MYVSGDSDLGHAIPLWAVAGAQAEPWPVPGPGRGGQVGASGLVI